MADKHDGRLAGWSDAQRLEFNLRRARGYKINHSAEYINETYPEAVEYRRPPVGRFASFREPPDFLVAERYLDIDIVKPKEG